MYIIIDISKLLTMWKYTCSDFLCVEILVKFLICYKTKVQGVSSNWKSKDQIDIHIKIQGWYCKSTQNLYVLYSLRGFVAGWKRVGGEGRGEHINKKREKKEKGRGGVAGGILSSPPFSIHIKVHALEEWERLGVGYYFMILFSGYLMILPLFHTFFYW